MAPLLKYTYIFVQIILLVLRLLILDGRPKPFRFDDVRPRVALRRDNCIVFVHHLNSNIPLLYVPPARRPL